MKYHEVTLPTALAAVNDGGVTRYYKGSDAVVAGLAGKQFKGRQCRDAAALGHGRLQRDRRACQSAGSGAVVQAWSTTPSGSSRSDRMWAGIEPGDQVVHSPIQIEFTSTGAVNVRVAGQWAGEFKGKKLRVACETPIADILIRREPCHPIPRNPASVPVDNLIVPAIPSHPA